MPKEQKSNKIPKNKFLFKAKKTDINKYPQNDPMAVHGIKSRDLILKVTLWLFAFSVVVCLSLWFLNSLNIYIKVGEELKKLVEVTDKQLNVLTSLTVAEIAGIISIIIKYYFFINKNKK